ncbi:hypothetical protein [Demequina sp.]|uniref:hypothetical protein n=1 Tax=Demequina sp. TaxID=2050685 RepID=UPI003D11305A
MDTLQRHVVREALTASLPYTGALAGSAALYEYGYPERPLDYFNITTPTTDPALFARMKAAVAAALETEAFTVTQSNSLAAPGALWAELEVRDGADLIATLSLESDVHRRHSPSPLDIGAVTHIDDVAAERLSSLYGGVNARDYVDVDALVGSGRFPIDKLAQHAARARREAIDPRLLAERLHQVHVIPREDLEAMGLTNRDQMVMSQRFEKWSKQLENLPSKRPSAPTPLNSPPPSLQGPQAGYSGPTRGL